MTDPIKSPIDAVILKFFKGFYCLFKKNPYKIVIFLIVVSSLTIYKYPEPFTNAYFSTTAFFNNNHTNKKDLISPYFDEKYYRAHYAAEIRKTGEEPIDHFIRRSGHFLGGDFNPNPWFKAKLYKERIFHCAGNPLVDYLKQPVFDATQLPKVIVYANHHQIFRAWIAVEALLRQKRFQVKLILPSDISNVDLQPFNPQLKRGLIIEKKNNLNLDFYQSPFLQEPEKYAAAGLKKSEHVKVSAPMTWLEKNGTSYVMHRLYNYTKWYKVGKINPLMINIAHYCDEPVVFAKTLGTTPYVFKQRMGELAPGFDLVFTNSDIDVPNQKIIPGYMHVTVSKQTTKKPKQYGVSYLLSLGQKNFNNFKKNPNLVLYYRKDLWDWQEQILMPRAFYLSNRDIKKFPKAMWQHAMPTSSKENLFQKQFSIAIENSVQENYFSEKILDCFMALSVPIYIGCPNIANYFDHRGIIIATDPIDLIKKVNSLNAKTYNKMLPYLLENQKRAEKLLNLEESLLVDFLKKTKQ